MKKYLLILSVIIFSLGCFLGSAFLPEAASFAQFPSFEIYPQGGTAYPAVTNINIPNTPTGDIETIAANVTDISGVSSVTAVIKNSSGTEKERKLMSKITGNSYSTAVDVTNYPNDTYTVDIIAADTLLNSSLNSITNINAYADKGSFSIGGSPPGSGSLPVCKDSSNGASVCISISQTINLNSISSFTVSPSTATAGTAVTLTADLGTANQTITFTDQTSSVNIGSAETNSSGVATIQYAASLGINAGSHTLMARYAGGSLSPSQKSATLNITSAGNCKESNNATVCITTCTNTTKSCP